MMLLRLLMVCRPLWQLSILLLSRSQSLGESMLITTRRCVHCHKCVVGDDGGPYSVV